VDGVAGDWSDVPHQFDFGTVPCSLVTMNRPADAVVVIGQSSR
jgi:hypothetical protein